MANARHRILFLKEIKDDGKLITFPRLGHPYEHHDQLTLRSRLSLRKTVERARQCNPDLPRHVQGMVIVRSMAARALISSGSPTRPHVERRPRRRWPTDWCLFVDGKGSLFSLIERTHKIGRPA